MFIIAEAGVNHNGSLDRAIELVKVAKSAGADAVKFQTFNASALARNNAPKAEYQKKTTGSNETQLQMLKKLELSYDDHHILAEVCNQTNIEFMSTPFDDGALNFLTNDIRIKRIKVGSGEITNAPFLLNIARKRLPIILSTGMSTLDEIEKALGVIAFGLIQDEDPSDIHDFKVCFQSEEGRSALKKSVTLLHCVSAYPAPLEKLNLLAINSLKKAFGLEVGFSDHSEGILAPVIAASIGATVLEKHFTLDKTLPGPDHRASLDFKELSAMISQVRLVSQILGSENKVPSETELEVSKVARRSIVAACSVRKGTLFTKAHLALKRPSEGMSPFCYWSLLGKPANKDYQLDSAIEL